MIEMSETIEKTSKEQILKSQPRLIFSALLCCALWGSAFPCVKIGYELLAIADTGSQILFAGYRFFLAGVLTFLLGSLMERRLLRIRRSSLPAVIGQGLLQTTGQYVCFYIALAHMSGSKGSVINASNAFFTIFFAHFFLKNEKIHLKKALGCLVGFAGVILINLGPGDMGGGFTFLGEGMMLLCAAVYGASSVTMKRISHRESAATLTAFQLLFGGAALIIIGALLGGKVTGFTLSSAGLLFYMALLSAVAFVVWTGLLRDYPAGRVAVFGFSIPVFGVLFSGIFLGERFLSWKNLAALFLICAGIVIVNLRKKEEKADG